jgi:hypothetical protein
MEKIANRKKGGRPKTEEHEKQNYRLVTYLDQTEKEAYLMFKQNNVGNNSFHLKNALLQYIGLSPQKKKIDKDVIRMMGELNKLASNTNQVAKHLNKGLSLDGTSTIEYLKNQKQIFRLIAEIKELITQ